MKPSYKLITLLLFIAGLTLNGCSGGDPNFSLLPEQDVFVNDVELNNKLDILFVIDNSGSMQDNQTNVANNINAFMNDFITKGYDYKVAVATSDAYRHIYVSSESAKQGYVKFKDGLGTSSSNHTGLFVLTPTTVYPSNYPNFAAAFDRHIRQGINGHADERSLQAFTAAIESNYNSGFLRPDAHLAIIIVSDEEDFSWNGSTNKQNANNGAGDYSNLYTPQSYIDKLVSYKGTTPDIFSVHAIGIFSGDTACYNANGGAQNGIKYMNRIQAVVDATDGILGSICNSSFASVLADMADDIGTKSTQFFLSRLPIVASITVKINGVFIPQDPDNGWQYDATNNSIKFYGSAQPSQGDLISIDFDPAEL